ncbi:outer membrane beta-barrel protein [Pedobacter cryophilus]|uniref:PorT family protein n=1 Tax=Pedobacter cryophilus TaxID=2571271 RepID=A0A4U1BTB7_9SPHI|nr:outer membrane beta-barrel protein [Pedobacter cryophilus]TKB95609.1 PorT family protein [Pedobacter cryophilus]
MKKIFLVAFALVIGGATFAQTTTTSSSVKSRFGLKGGLSLPKYKYVNDDANTSDETETTTNFHLTGYADVPVSNLFSIQPGISIQGKGAKYFDNGTTQVEDNVLAIEVPVNLLANLPAGPGHLFIGGGPYAGFNVSAQRETISGTTSERKLSIGDNSGDDLKALDFGVNFLAGYQLNSGLNFGAGYGLGLTNLRPTSTSTTNVEQNNRVLSFSVGYAF